jgi:hypothetical protein
VNRTELRLVLGAVLAVAVPGALLHLAAADRRAAGLTAAPFAWPWVLLAHLVTALPLGFLAASRLRASPTLAAVPRGWWVVFGLGTTGLACALGPGLAEGAAGAEAGPAALLVLRSVLAVGLVVPWCAAAIDPGDVPLPAARPGLALGLGLGLAVVPAGLFADAAVTARTKQAHDLLDRERPARALPVVTGLCELGSERPVGKQTPAELRRALAGLVPKLQRAAERPLPAAAPPVARVERAALLIRVDRLDDAAALLEPLAAADDTAGMLLATVYRDLGRWAESDRLYAAALDKFRPRAGADPQARSVCTTALDGLAFNAREAGRAGEAEAVLRRGLEALPGEAAYFHFQLGRHHADGGRPREALDHLRAAAALDPDRFGDRAAEQVRSLRTTTYGCALSPP